MKTCVTTYSFRSCISSGRLTLLECIQKTREMGFDGIEFVSFTPPEGIVLKEYINILRDTCAKNELEIVNYTIGGDFLNGSKGSIDDEIARLKGEADIASALGASGMRHDLTSGFAKGARGWRGFEDVLPRLAKGCWEVTEYAAGLGVRTMIENHGFFSQDSERIEKLVNTVAHDNFGLLVDMGNFLCVDEDPVTAVSRVAPYAFHVHAKDFHVKSGSGPNPGQGFFESRGGNFLRGDPVF